MTNKTKAKPETDVPMAERIDMNDPSLTDAEAVARNLGIAETAAQTEDGAA